jgi:hypothetical protein
MRKSVVWIPVLLVGAMAYWTLALGLGGMSLMRVTSEAEDVLVFPDARTPDGVATDTYQSITVNLGEEAELGLQPNTPVMVDLVSDHQIPRAGDGDQGAGGQHSRGSGRRSRAEDRGPGETAF